MKVFLIAAVAVAISGAAFAKDKGTVMTDFEMDKVTAGVGFGVGTASGHTSNVSHSDFGLNIASGASGNNPGHGICTAGRCASDIRLKRDIIQVSRLDNSLGLYRYRYKWSDQIYVGVMAQEVAVVMPDAVVPGSDGYLRVDYSRLGLHLMTWDEWVASGGEKGLKKSRL